MLNKAAFYTITLLGVLVIFNSCKKEYESIQDIDERKIQEYISRNNLNVIKDPSGFYYEIIEQGTGDPLLNKDSVLFTYDHKSINGNVYYSTPEYTNDGNYLGYITRDKSGFYPGQTFRIAMGALNRGGKVKLIIPSYLAFGKNGVDVLNVLTVPSNEIIVSDITTFPEANQTARDESRIVEYLDSKGLTAIRHSSGVYYIVSQAGTGTAIELTSKLKVKFTGKLFTGSVFDQTTGDDTFDFTLSDQISGWKKVLPLFRSGTKVRIFVPSTLAYGPNTNEGVPANSCLDFEIEIVEVTE